MGSGIVKKSSMIRTLLNKIILDKELNYREMYFIMTNQKLIKTNFGTNINFLLKQKNRPDIVVNYIWLNTLNLYKVRY